MAVRSRDTRQRSIIATRAMANREMRKCKADRDRAFAELVYRKIFMRTGGVVRSWTTIIANVNRLRFLVSAVFARFATILLFPVRFELPDDMRGTVIMVVRRCLATHPLDCFEQEGRPHVSSRLFHSEASSARQPQS